MVSTSFSCSTTATILHIGNARPEYLKQEVWDARGLPSVRKACRSLVAHQVRTEEGARGRVPRLEMISDRSFRLGRIVPLRPMVPLRREVLCRRTCSLMRVRRKVRFHPWSWRLIFWMCRVQFREGSRLSIGRGGYILLARRPSSSLRLPST